jgi:3-oxoacyl-[acyl-carrier-protein] synthase-3
LRSLPWLDAATLDTSDEWIVTRTGIRERRIGAPGETTSTMGAEAVRRIMAQRRLQLHEIEALIVATVSPDTMFPATVCLIQDRLGLQQTWGFDLSAACSGAIMDPLDRTTAVLFGDGAGAVLLEPAEPGYGLLDFVHRVDGSGGNDLIMPAGGSAKPATMETVAAREHFLRQNGRVVFKYAVSQMAATIETLLQRNDLSPADIAMVIPHQANQRILDATAERLGLPPNRMASVIARYGNTTLRWQ